MHALRITIATAAVAATTIGGAYAAGVVNKNGHPVDDHAAHGQSVAAAARAHHLTATATTSASQQPTAPSGPQTGKPTDEPTGGATDRATGEPGSAGKHLGMTKAHRHLGHTWGVGHGAGEPTRTAPVHPAAPVPPARPAHPAHPVPPAHPSHGNPSGEQPLTSPTA